MNNNPVKGGKLCDLQKAFACANYKILLHELKFYGNDGKFKTLIKSYLKGRQQKVTLGNVTNSSKSSKWEKIKKWCPTRLDSWPLFFILYINYLPNIINTDNNKVLFVDDTSILVNDSNKIDFNILTKQFQI